MAERDGFTDRQRAFIAWYCKLLNATRAAERAGYTGNANTLGVTGHDLLTNPNIRAEIDRRLRANIPSPDEVLTRIGQQAIVDVTPYVQEDGSLDVARMRDDGVGHMVVGAKPGRHGPEIALASPQTAQKLLARYHQLLSDHVDVDVHGDVSLDVDTLDALAGQIAVAKSTAGDTEDSDSAQDDTG